MDWCKGRGIDIEDMDLCERINYLFQYAPNQFKFTDGRYFDGGGNEVTQTPIWVRPEVLMKDRFGDFFHVVGHTFGEPEIQTDGDPGGIIKMDALGMGYYLVINDGDPIIKKLKDV